MSNEKTQEESRKETELKPNNKMQQLYLIEVESKGIRIASIVSIILAIILFILEIILQGKQNFGMYSMVGCFCTVSFCYYGFRTKRKQYSLTGLVWGALTVFFIVLYILDMVDHGGAL